MSFGSDSPGGSAEGIGGNESGIGGDSGSGSGGSDFGGFGDEYAGFDFGDFDFGGWNNPGTSTSFGDVGFGPEGTGYAGQGFLNSNIAGISGLSNYELDYMRTLPAAKQDEIFSTVISPLIGQFYTDISAKAGMKVGKTVFNGLLNAALPGLGTLSRVTGATGYLASRAQDASFSTAVSQQLGLSKSANFDTSTGEDIFLDVLNSGKSTGEILSAIDTTIRQQGGDMASWDDIWGGITGSTAAGAATGAAQTQASYQQRALDYLKSRESTPLEISGGALQQLGGLYGLPGGVGDQQTFIDQARQSPLYGAIMGGREAGEESIMRNAGMTGGLRSGNVNDALYKENVNLENRALLGAYGEQLGGLQFLAQRDPGGQANIANMMQGIGGTLAGGQYDAAQANQQGTANLIGLGGAAYQAVGGLGGIAGGIGDLYQGAQTGGLSGVGSAIASWF